MMEDNVIATTLKSESSPSSLSSSTGVEATISTLPTPGDMTMDTTTTTTTVATGDDATVNTDDKETSPDLVGNDHVGIQQTLQENGAQQQQQDSGADQSHAVVNFLVSLPPSLQQETPSSSTTTAMDEAPKGNYN